MTKIAASPSKHPRATKAQLVKEIGRLERRLRAAESIADERKEAEKSLGESEELFRRSFDDAGVGAVFIEMKGRIQKGNRAFRDMLGYAEKELVGKSFADITHPDDVDIGIDILREMAEGKRQTVHLEKRYLHKNGKIVWATVSGSVIRDADGNALYSVAHVQNITERKRAEEELKSARQVAERASLAKTRFLAAASHDVRQPLFALGLFLGSLSERISDEDNRRVIADAEKSHAELGSLFDALLDISKLDAEVIEPNSETFPVDSLLKDMKRDFEPQARDDGLDMRVIDSSAIVDTDRTLVNQVVRNLVSNAVNHTASGRVLLGCRHRDGALRIEVWDTGPGIPADQFERIFEEFHQLDYPSRDRAKGLGLGLAIARRAATLLGKQIEVWSTVGKGSMFAIEVRVGDPTLVAEKPLEIMDAIGPRTSDAMIMVIEDDKMARVALSELLTVWGFEVVAAASAAEAETRLKQMTGRPDLVVADHHLGNEQTGIDAIETVRNICDAPVPAFILSGDTAPEVLREVEAKGLTMLHKPIDTKELRKEVQRFLTSR